MVVSTLSPAESYLLLNPKEHIEKECFKYVALDLILKQVLKIEKETKQASIHSQSYTFEFLRSGKAFLTYNPQLYETFFLKPLKNGTVKIQLRYYGKNVLQKYLDSLRDLTKHIAKGKSLNGLISPSIFHYFTGNFKVSNSGKIVQKELKNRLNEINSLLLTNKSEAFKRFPEIGNNFLLLSNFDNSMLSELKDVFKELDVNTLSGMDYGGWNDEVDFLDLGGFDCVSSCSSGCSSCSSGCSGCGGCS